MNFIVRLKNGFMKIKKLFSSKSRYLKNKSRLRDNIKIKVKRYRHFLKGKIHGDLTTPFKKYIIEHLLSVIWSASLFFGGMILLVYFWSVGYLPVLDIGSATTVLISSSITGIAYITFFSFMTIMPGLSWSFTNEFDNSTWKNKFIRGFFRLIVFLVSILIIYVWLSNIDYKNLNEMGIMQIIAILVQVFVVNYFVATGKNKQWWFTPTMGVTLLIFILLPINGATLISNITVKMFKIGNIENASLVLDKQGCQTLDQFKEEFSLKVSKTILDTCTVTSLNIISRVGQEYYLGKYIQNPPSCDTANKNSKDCLRFVMPASHVLSWYIPTIELIHKVESAPPKLNKPKPHKTKQESN